MQSLTIKILFVFFVSIVPVTEAAAQTAHKLSGVITDEFNHPPDFDIFLIHIL